MLPTDLMRPSISRRVAWGAGVLEKARVLGATRAAVRADEKRADMVDV